MASQTIDTTTVPIIQKDPAIAEIGDADLNKNSVYETRDIYRPFVCTQDSKNLYGQLKVLDTSTSETHQHFLAKLFIVRS